MNGSARSAAAVPSVVSDALRWAGRPLNPDVRARYEPWLGRTLGDVRIHTDDHAAEAAQQVGAGAFTVGTDIAFGEYQPDTEAGRRLLAHELVHVAQQDRNGPQLQKQEVANPAIENVSGVIVSLADNKIAFQTGSVSYVYTLTSCTIPEGSYDAGVSIKGNVVRFDFSTVKGGELFRFGFTIEQGQQNPITLFRSQKRVGFQVVAHADFTSSAPPQRDLNTRVALFKRLVKKAGQARLAANRSALLVWKEHVRQNMTPEQVRAQIDAQEVRDMIMQAEHGDLRTRAIIDQALVTEGPNRRWVLGKQAKEEYTACTGCHAMVQADAMDAELKRQGLSAGAPLARVQQGAATVPKATAPAPTTPGLAPAKAPESAIPGWVAVSNSSMFPAIQQAATAVNVTHPFLEPLGPRGYDVLPPEVLGSTASATSLMNDVISRIEQRRADFLKLSGMIDEADFDYLKLRPIVRELLPSADADVQARIRAEMDSAEAWATVKAIVIGLATLGTLLLIIFPPTTALGAAGATALIGTLSAFQVYEGLESYRTGSQFALGRGAHDVLDPEQQQAATMMMGMGVLNVVLGGIGLGSAALSGVRLIRLPGGRTPAGDLPPLDRIEATAGNNKVVISGLTGKNPRVKVTGPDGAVIHEGAYGQVPAAAKPPVVAATAKPPPAAGTKPPPAAGTKTPAAGAEAGGPEVIVVRRPQRTAAPEPAPAPARSGASPKRRPAFSNDPDFQRNLKDVMRSETKRGNVDPVETQLTKGDPRVQVRSRLGHGPQPRPFQRGNFAHDNAELLIDEAGGLPRGLTPEVTVRRPNVRDIRIDRVDWKNRIAYEIRPDSPAQVANMQRQMPARLRALNEVYPGPTPWQGRIVSYSKVRAVEVLMQQYGYTTSQAQEILKVFGFIFP